MQKMHLFSSCSHFTALHCASPFQLSLFIGFMSSGTNFIEASGSKIPRQTSLNIEAKKWFFTNIAWVYLVAVRNYHQHAWFTAARIPGSEKSGIREQEEEKALFFWSTRRKLFMVVAKCARFVTTMARRAPGTIRKDPVHGNDETPPSWRFLSNTLENMDSDTKVILKDELAT